MSQITTGLRSVLSKPQIYDALQDMMGAQSARRELVRNYIRPFSRCRVLDIGCGTARILDDLSDVEYYGFDQSQKYIAYAGKRYGDKGHFKCALVEQANIDVLQPFDIVIATGVLHHLDDEKAIALMSLAHSALRVGARLVTIDPCYVVGQNLVARFLVSRDRGLNVRSPGQYELLAKSVFSKVKVEVKHKAWIPYTHCIMECQR